MNDRKLCWLALNLYLSEFPRVFRRIVEHFPRLDEVFQAGRQELQALGVEQKAAESLTSPRILDIAAREFKRLRKEDGWIVTREEEDYPESLRETFDPPFVLYGAGRMEVLKQPSVAVVGARKPSPYGRAVAERLSMDLASRGLAVVSGMARGIDSVAHWGALKGGRTIAVLGSGLEAVYPPENRPLFRKIAGEGAVLTEYPLASPPLDFHFPLRNRIIAGLSLGLVVVEATCRSGSLITAELAMDGNREVMAVPGNVTSELSRGTHWLIKNGAKLVETWEDVAEELPSPFRENLLSLGKEEKGSNGRDGLEPRAKKVYELLKIDTLTQIDEIVETTEFSVAEILSILLDLELRGLVIQCPGKHYQRRM